MIDEIRLDMVEEKHGELDKLHLDLGRETFREMVHHIRDVIDSEYTGPDEIPIIVREDSRNPMIKTGDGEKVYFEYSSGRDGVIKLNLLSEEKLGAIVDVLKESKGPTDITEHIDEATDSIDDESTQQGGRGPTDEPITEPEDYQGGSGDEVESENGPASYIGPSDKEQDVSKGGVRGVESFSDGSIRFKPPFKKSDVDYKNEGDPSFDETHSRCKDCAHYIDGGGCKMVQGGIEDDSYCEDLYADIGVFGHKHDIGVEENLIIWGDGFSWSIEDAKEFAMDMRERIEQRIREIDGE